MNQKVYDRVLNWVLVGLGFFIIFIVGIFMFIEYYNPGATMTENEAFQIALHSSACNQGNTSVVSYGFYNKKKNTWNFNIELEDESELINDNCDGVCVVYEETKNAKLDLRCFEPAA